MIRIAGPFPCRPCLERMHSAPELLGAAVGAQGRFTKVQAPITRAACRLRGLEYVHVAENRVLV
jgi:hypothetical protein